MLKKPKHEEHVNLERWLVSYADFITLLFAFFVVMYSVSAINEGKFRTVSESIKAALNPVVSQQVTRYRFDIGTYRVRPSILPPIMDKKAKVIQSVQKFSKKAEGLGAGKGLSNKVVAVATKNGVLITIPDHMLFESGQAEIHPAARAVLEDVATVIADSAMDIREINVQGHTDNIPIHTLQFPSNWELSSARAVSVVRLLTESYGVPSWKIVASGHGEFKPVVENDTVENRTKNRRVEILLVMEEPVVNDPTAHIEVSPETDPVEENPPLPSALQPPPPPLN
jgi:chemotaxis protein MotB